MSNGHITPVNAREAAVLSDPSLRGAVLITQRWTEFRLYVTVEGEDPAKSYTVLDAEDIDAAKVEAATKREFLQKLPAAVRPTAYRLARVEVVERHLDAEFHSSHEDDDGATYHNVVTRVAG